MALALGPEHSRIRPKLYTWIFICCDIFSLILQGAGGGLAASAGDNKSSEDIGNDLMISGIVWQVATLLIFACLSIDYFSRLYKNRSTLSPASKAIHRQLKFRLFFIGIFVSLVTIMTRCVFRIAEMSGGWRNPIMQDEVKFMVLDGGYVI